MPAERCQPPRRTITPPKVKAPAGSVDCHFHISGRILSTSMPQRVAIRRLKRSFRTTSG